MNLRNETAGAIYGSTLNRLVDSGGHAGFAAAALTPTESLTPHGLAPPYLYNPYPEYNTKAWRASNMGAVVACDGPSGRLQDLVVFSGHPDTFTEPPIGSYIPLDIDSNLCFERETRLGVYGFQDNELQGMNNETGSLQKRTNWDDVNWGVLQQSCVEKNSDRYSQSGGDFFASEGSVKEPTSASGPSNGTMKTRRMEATDDEAEARKQGLHGMPKVTIKAKSRTALIIRAESGKEYTENEKQNIRSLITELSLRSGGEYQVFLLVLIKEDLPIWSDKTVYEKAVQDNVPQEFWDMTSLWNEGAVKEKYPKIPEPMSNANEMQWLSVQKFAQENPQFQYYWNWDLDSRYTGHHYNLFEKLAAFAKAQPRKGLWERNERFYISSVHGPYDSKFRRSVEIASGSDTIWGSPSNASVRPVGPVRPSLDPKEDKYSWGVDEDADLISLSPIFNPINTTWFSKDDVFGYSGAEYTLRRASIGTSSRVSKKLLNTMHAENLRGNFLGNEMATQTVALLHGLKAVYAPIPMFFDRKWEGNSLEKYFNPGPKGESGSTEESPFSSGKEEKFDGSTWGYRATPPTRLYNNWLGREDSGIGGAEVCSSICLHCGLLTLKQWEKIHGRTCLPPMLLHPIKM